MCRSRQNGGRRCPHPHGGGNSWTDAGDYTFQRCHTTDRPPYRSEEWKRAYNDARQTTEDLYDQVHEGMRAEGYNPDEWIDFEEAIRTGELDELQERMKQAEGKTSLTAEEMRIMERRGRKMGTGQTTFGKRITRAVGVVILTTFATALMTTKGGRKAVSAIRNTQEGYRFSKRIVGKVFGKKPLERVLGKSRNAEKADSDMRSEEETALQYS